MSIFILEDNVFHAQRLKEMILEICNATGIRYDALIVTSRSDEMLQKLALSARIPIYFLDIELKGEERKGLQVAQEIRKRDAAGLIVFVTTHSELAPISYHYLVSALTFIDKGWPLEEQTAILEKCLLRYKELNDYTGERDDFVVDTEQAAVRIPFSELAYITTDGPHRLSAVTVSRMVQYYGTLKEAEAFDDRLLRCHQSYVVNADQVATYETENRQLVLESGHRIPVSRRLMRKVRQRVKGEKQ